jgi:hypothetical protein
MKMGWQPRLWWLVWLVQLAQVMQVWRLARLAGAAGATGPPDVVSLRLAWLVLLLVPVSGAGGRGVPQFAHHCTLRAGPHERCTNLVSSTIDAMQALNSDFD